MAKIEQSPRTEFFTLLHEMAAMVNHEMPKLMIPIWERIFAPYGFEKVNSILIDHMKKLNSRSPFPSVAEIEAKMNPEISSDAIARDTTEILVRLVSRKGRYWNIQSLSAEMIQEASTLGSLVVDRFGGWQIFCEQFDRYDLPIIKAQLREFIKVILEKKIAGLGHDQHITLDNADPKVISLAKKLTERDSDWPMDRHCDD